jgi:hypothetical protein
MSEQDIFEQWAKSMSDLDLTKENGVGPSYCHQSTRWAWIGWQAKRNGLYGTMPLPDGWKVTERPNGGAATYHRARWENGVLKCWECPAEWTPPSSQSDALSEQNNGT